MSEIGRATVQLLSSNIVDITEDKQRAVVQITLEGLNYPPWKPGNPPIVFAVTDLIRAWEREVSR